MVLEKYHIEKMETDKVKRQEDQQQQQMKLIQEEQWNQRNEQNVSNFLFYSNLLWFLSENKIKTTQRTSNDWTNENALGLVANSGWNERVKEVGEVA